VQYTNFSSVCNNLVTTAINTWNLPTAIDCNNMNRKWRDNWGGTWYIAQANKSRTVTGWLDTGTSYNAKAKCGWWQLTGSISDSGYTYINANFYGTKPQKYCNTQMVYSGTTTPSKSSGSYRSQQGYTGPFELYSLEPPAGFTWANWTPQTPLFLPTLAPWAIE